MKMWLICLEQQGVGDLSDKKQPLVREFRDRFFNYRDAKRLPLAVAVLLRCFFGYHRNEERLASEKCSRQDSITCFAADVQLLFRHDVANEFL